MAMPTKSTLGLPVSSTLEVFPKQHPKVTSTQINTYHAGKHKAIVHLAVIQEALVALVNSASLHLASTRGAGASAAGVGQINTCLLQI